MDQDGERLTLELFPAPRRVRGPVVYAVLATLLGLGAWLGSSRLALDVIPAPARAWVGGLLGLGLAAGLAATLWPRLRPPTRLEPVALIGHRLLVPRSVFSSGVDRLDLRDVLHLGIARGPEGFFEVLTHRRRYRLPLRSFRQPELLPRLGLAFGRALSRLPGGPEHLASIERSHALGQRLLRRPVLVTRGLLAIIGVVYAIQLGLAGLDATPFDTARVAIQLGANLHGSHVDAPWRLLTATFLHGSLLHLLMNGIALYALGTIIERSMGPARLIVVFIGSAGFGGLLSSVASTGAYSVGASGGIFGLLGAMAALHLFSREPIPAGFRQPLRWWVLIVGLNLGLPLLVPIIDAAGHFGGSVAGLALGAGFVRARGFTLGGEVGRWGRGLASVATAAALVSVGFGFVYALQPLEHHRRVLDRAILRGQGDEPLASARAAVGILRRHDAPEHLVRAAEAWLAQEGVDPEADPAVRLAWSELLEARGALEAALELRWEVLGHQGTGAFPALLDGLIRLEARPLVLAPAAEVGVELRRLDGDDHVELVLEPPVTSTVAVFFLLRDPADRPVGLMEWPVWPRDQAVSRLATTLPEPARAALDRGGRFEETLWATPPLSEAPRLHVFDSTALGAWRVLPSRERP